MAERTPMKELSICELTDLPEVMCSHCTGDDDVDPCEGLAIIFSMVSKYNSKCWVDDTHKIEKGSTISSVKLTGEPDHRALGYACERCTLRLKGTPSFGGGDSLDLFSKYT